MPSKPDRIVLDTNLLISFLISNSFNKFDKLISENKIVFILSAGLINEFMDVASRPKFRKVFNEQQIFSLLTKIQNHAEIISVKSSVTICRDANDNFLLELCIDGKADYLITGDEDLLILNPFKKTKIIKFMDYLKKF
jgi:putative PIN family toxin of toxin-antitoxin system